jgi:DNA-binding IclR family transcriptional regulator
MKTVQSIERAFAIMAAVAKRPAGLTEISDAVDLPKSTVSRILHTLECESAVTRDPEAGTYAIGPTVRGLNRGAASLADLAAHARPYLAMLARELGEDAGFGAADKYELRCISQESADNAITVADWTGTMIPMHQVPGGLVILAHWPQDRVDRALRAPLEPATEHNIVDPLAIRARLEQIRAEGHCWFYEEYSQHLNSVAAPVFGPTGVLGAIYVHGPSFRFPAEGTADAVAERLRKVARLISDTFGAEKRL